MALSIKLVTKIGELIFQRTDESLRMAEFWLRNADPKQPKTQYLWGLLHSQRGQDDRAVAAHKRAVELSGRQHPAYLYNYAIALGLHGRVDEAIDILRYSIASFPDHLLSYVGMAQLLAGKSRHEDALPFIDHALQLVDQVATPEHYLTQALPPAPNQRRAQLLYLKAAFLFTLHRFDELFATIGQSLGYFRDQTEPLTLRELTSEYLEAMGQVFETAKPLLGFLRVASEVYLAEGSWDLVPPLFTFEQWGSRLPDQLQLECFEELNHQVEDAQRTGIWLPALRAAASWHAKALTYPAPDPEPSPAKEKPAVTEELREAFRQVAHRCQRAAADVEAEWLAFYVLRLPGPLEPEGDGIRAHYGAWESGDPDSADNDRIDADLARAYGEPS